MCFQQDLMDAAPAVISYTEAELGQVTALADRSSYCSQQITYSCERAGVHKGGDGESA